MTNDNPGSPFGSFMEADDFSDLTLSCHGQEFKVHKLVVGTQSPVLKNIILGQSPGRHGNVIDMNVFGPGVVKQLVQFLYKGDYDEVPFGPQQQGAGEEGQAISFTFVSEDNGSVVRSDDGAKEESIKVEQDETNAAVVNSPPANATSPCQRHSATGISLLGHICVNSIGSYYGVSKLVALANSKITALFDEAAIADKSWLASLPAAVELATQATGDRELVKILATASAAEDLCAILDLGPLRAIHALSDFSMELLRCCAGKMNALKKHQEERGAQFLKLERSHAKLQGQVANLTQRHHDQAQKLSQATAAADAKRQTVVTQQESAAHAAAQVKKLKDDVSRQRQRVLELESEVEVLKSLPKILNRRNECRNCGCEFDCWFDLEEGNLRCAECRCRHE